MSGEHTGPTNSPRTSPRTPTESISYQTSLRGGGDRQAENRTLESTGDGQSNGETVQPQPIPLRSLGVHTILNPAEIQPSLLRERAEETASSPREPSVTAKSSPRAVPPFGFPGSEMAGRGQTTPTIDDQASTAPSSVERGSPITGRPYPPIAAARRVLPPHSPRLISPSQPHPLRNFNSSQFSVGSQDAGRMRQPEGGIPGRPEQPYSARGSPLAPQLSRVASPASRPPSSMPSLPTTSRSISQPVPGHPVANLQGRQFFPGPSGVQPRQPSGYPSCNPYAPPVVSQGHGVYSPQGGDPRWAGASEHPLQYGSAGVRSFAFGEGQAALRIQPAHGEAFIVPVDTHQGSRQADEKRQRNAGASQRFRKRKKDRETQERMEHQRMESQYRDLEARIQALENDRERLRADRDRLRDIVFRTPSISELAYQGPSSPEASNAPGPQSLMSRSTYGAADPETGERSSQRRRTDPHPQVDYVATPYGSAPGSLPPITTSVYPTSLSHPGTPSAMSQAPQLPPLRLGSAGGTPTTAVSAASTPVQSYQQLKRESYETGWATGARGTSDPSQR